MRRRPTELFDIADETFDEVGGPGRDAGRNVDLLRLHFGGMLADAPFLMASSLVRSHSVTLQQPR